MAKLETLTDNFDFQNDSKWVWDLAGSNTIVGGQLAVTTLGPDGSYIGSVGTFDLADSHMTVELVQPNPDDFTSTWVYVQHTGGQYSGFAIRGGAIDFVEAVSGGVEDNTTIDYDADLHRWLRLRESAGTIYWDTSPDGLTWTNRRNKTDGRTYTGDSAFLYTDGPSGTALFDNFNLPPGNLPPSSLERSLAQTRETTEEIRRARRAIKLAKPIMWIYKNNPDGSPGLIPVGRVPYQECPKYTWPKKKNISSQGYFSIRATHWMAKFITKIPNDPDECKNYVVRVDMYGGHWRWTGLGHHWAAETKDGVDVVTFHFNDDMSYPQFMLAPPNPLLPLDIFQFPRVWPEFGPSVYCVSLLFLLNIIRTQALSLFNLNLPDDPFSLQSWIDQIDPTTWQVHIKCNPLDFFLDSSLWTVLGSRMNTIDSVIADALEDGQLCLDYRRIFTDEGELVDGLLYQTVANGALVFEVTDRSGFALTGGTFFDGTAAAGLTRSILQWGTGFIEDTLVQVTDDQTLYPDEYWQQGFMGTFATAPGITIRDSHMNDLQSTVTHAPATAGTVVVGGDNPTADAIVKLIIESVGNLLGYFLLGGFDSLGDMAADVIMPFLVGTIFAWVEWKNFGRTTNMGWAHYIEVYQQGAEANAWSLSALAALRGGFKSTEAQTSHTMIIGQDTWLIPGLHCQIGDRIASTSGALQRMGIDVLFVNQIEEMTLDGSADGKFDFTMKVGQNKAAMSQGERAARLLKKTLDILQNIGVHLIS